VPINVSDQETTSVLEVGFNDVQEGQSSSESLGKGLCRQQDAHPLALDVLLLTRFGADWLKWTPEALQYHIDRVFGAISTLNFHKIMALKTLHMVDTFWQRWEVFAWCAMPFNNIPPDFVVMQVPTVAQCAVASAISRRIRDDMEWSEELKEYIRVVYKHEELWCAAPELGFAAPDATGIPVDPRHVGSLLETAMQSGNPPVDETVDAEQARHLWDIAQYINDFSSRAEAQLRRLKR